MRAFFGKERRRPNGDQAEENPGPVTRRRAAWGVLLGVVIACWVAGLVVGRSLFRASGSPEVGKETPWQHRLPEIPAHVSSDYRALLEETGSAVSEVMEAHPDSPSAVAALGLLHYLAHDWAGEVECWEQCLRLDRTNWLAYSRLVALFQQRGDYERIVELMRGALALEPGNTTYHGILASALMDANRYEEAKDVLESHLQVARGTAETYQVLGEIYNQLNQLEKAKRSLETAIALAPRRMDALYTLSTVCAKLGETERAAQYRDQFQKLKTAQLRNESKMGIRHEMVDSLFIPVRVAEIMTFAGKAYLEHGNLEVAEKRLRRAAAIDPKHVECWRTLSTVYDRQGRLQEALQCVKELRKLEPNSILHYRNEGILYGRLNRFEEAERVFRDLCRLAPQSSFAYAALAELYLRTGRNLAEAKSLAEKAVELEPTARNSAVLAALAKRAGDPATARSALEGAVRLDPNNAKYYQRTDDSVGKQQ